MGLESKDEIESMKEKEPRYFLILPTQQGKEKNRSNLGSKEPTQKDLWIAEKRYFLGLEGLD